MTVSAAQRPPLRTGGQILVDQLTVQGVDKATCVPGESYLSVLDALHDADIDLIVCRNEGGAAMMAEAYGKLTGRPGVCFVTRGPGAGNASPGVHVAQQDSTPMILFVGQIAREMRGRDAFQEVDYEKAYGGGFAKWAVEIQSADRIPEIVARAFRVAMQGRPGPVVVALPEDVLTETAAVADSPFVTPVEPSPTSEDVERLKALIEASERPIAVLGGSRWTQAACDGFRAFAEAFELPVACSFRRAQLFSADSPVFAGDLGLGPNPALARRVRSADLVLLIGGRFSEIPSSAYALMTPGRPDQTVVHVHPGEGELGRVYQPALAVQASPSAFARAVAALRPSVPPAWAAATARARAEYLAWTDVPPRNPGAFQYGEVMAWLRDRLPEDAIVCNGAGNYASWIHRFMRFRRFGGQLAPVSGSMGYGVPAAVMAKRMNPERLVVAFAGDGCFLMNGQEMATAAQHAIPLVVVVVDNGMFGTIRMHQERDYPHRVSGTDLSNPDFAALARAYGGHGERVERTEQFAPAFERAVASGKPALIHCILDPEAILPGRTLSQMRPADAPARQEAQP